MPHFGVWGNGVGPMTPKFELWQDFCTMHLSANFHHPRFNYSEVIMLTNKETDTAQNIHLALLCYAGYKCKSI